MSRSNVKTKEPETPSSEAANRKAFVRRLHQALDNLPRVPEARGRQAWLLNELRKNWPDLTAQSLKRWFDGDAVPRPDKMKAIAATVGADIAWLTYGHNPALQPKEQRARNAMVDGAVNLFTELVQVNGGHPAFPDDPQEAELDLSAIINGKQWRFTVYLGQEVSKGRFRFVTSPKVDSSTFIGVVQNGPTEFDFIILDLDLLSAHGKARGGYIEVEITRPRTNYFSGKDQWQKITSFRDSPF